MIEIRSYDLELAELVIISRCINNYPRKSFVSLSKVLGISKSNLYRKIEMLKDERIIKRLIDAGYTITETSTIIKEIKHQHIS